MKGLNAILSSSLALILMACGDSKNNALENTSDGYNATTNTADTDINDSLVTYERDTSATTDNQGQGFTQEEYERQRNQQMYTRLNMTQDQIQRYENSIRTAVDNWNRDNPQKIMTAQNRMDLERASLKPILDESQLQRYKDWIDLNPYRY